MPIRTLQLLGELDIDIVVICFLDQNSDNIFFNIPKKIINGPNFSK